jgi:hypothetical protein
VNSAGDGVLRFLAWNAYSREIRAHRLERPFGPSPRSSHPSSSMMPRPTRNLWARINMISGSLIGPSGITALSICTTSGS